MDARHTDAFQCLDSDCPYVGPWVDWLAHAALHPLPHPSDRAAWLASRRTFVGASEIAAVVGANPHAGPLEVWHSKVTGRIEEPFVPREIEGGGMVVRPPNERGNLYEVPLLEDFAKRYGCTYEQPATGRHPALPWLGATPDAVVHAGPLVQVKVVGHRTAPDWDSGVPIYYQLQVQTEMEVWGVDRCIVLADIGEIREYEVKRDTGLMGPALDIGAEFWRYVQSTEAPVDFDLRATRDETLMALWPRPKRIDLAPASPALVKLASAYVAARDRASEEARDQKGLGAQLKALVGDGAGYRWRGGKVTWSALADGGRRLDVRIK